LRAAGEAQVTKHLQAQIGKTHHILMENPHMGRTEQFTEVTFDAPQTEGQIVRARISGTNAPQLTA
jgi:threonylcarbamoyladenosine tRNA methylthiotransferase MtaB